MKTTVIAGYIFLLLLIGCNNIQDAPARRDENSPLEYQPQEQTDMISVSYDECLRSMRRCLLKQDYNGALKYILQIENSYLDQENLAIYTFTKCYVNLMLDKKQEVSKDLEYLAEQTPSPELFWTYWCISTFEMRMKNYRKAIEYLDKIELPETELTRREYGGILLMIHITRASALLMLNEYESGKKEYQMFLDDLKHFGDFYSVDHFIDFINLMNKAIEQPDEYVVVISDQPLPGPIPAPDDPEKVEMAMKYYLDLVSRIDNTVVATYTVKL
jgi:tetratricopeptide (TPR) repeat protein